MISKVISTLGIYKPYIVLTVHVSAFFVVAVIDSSTIFDLFFVACAVNRKFVGCLRVYLVHLFVFLAKLSSDKNDIGRGK